MKKLVNYSVIMMAVLFIFSSCGQSVDSSNNQPLNDESLKSELEGKAFGNWKTVMVQFQTGGRYEAYLKASESAYDKHSMGEGTWEVSDGKITLSENDSQSETVTRVKGVYTYDGTAIESATHRLNGI
jgi:hypothetical protein